MRSYYRLREALTGFLKDRPTGRAETALRWAAEIFRGAGDAAALAAEPPDADAEPDRLRNECLGLFVQLEAEEKRTTAAEPTWPMWNGALLRALVEFLRKFLAVP